MGWGAEDALFQGEDEEFAEGVVSAGPVSESDEETGVGASDGIDANAGRELVQESAAEGSSGGG